MERWEEELKMNDRHTDLDSEGMRRSRSTVSLYISDNVQRREVAGLPTLTDLTLALDLRMQPMEQETNSMPAISGLH